MLIKKLLELMDDRELSILKESLLEEMQKRLKTDFTDEETNSLKAGRRARACQLYRDRMEKQAGVMLSLSECLAHMRKSPYWDLPKDVPVK